VSQILSSIKSRVDRGSSVKAGPFELGELADSPSKPDAEQVSTSSPASADHGKAIAGVQSGDDPQHTFLLRSSWHGLKILKACQWAARSKRTLKVREFSKVGTPMAYDYAFGFLIAAFSADLVITSANPQSGLAVVVSVHPTVDSRIDEILEGYISTHPEHSEPLRDDLNALLSYLRSQ